MTNAVEVTLSPQYDVPSSFVSIEANMAMDLIQPWIAWNRPMFYTPVVQNVRVFMPHQFLELTSLFLGRDIRARG